jgi:hypothetical protein
MDWLTEEPERILGNVALASLLAGGPAGALLGGLGGLLGASPASAADWVGGVGSGALFGVFIAFLFGACYILPALFVLRRVGFAGPASVVLLALLPVLVLLAEDARMGLVSLGIAVPVTLVFCRLAYRSNEDGL